MIRGDRKENTSAAFRSWVFGEGVLRPKPSPILVIGRFEKRKRSVGNRFSYVSATLVSADS
ncbi:MAG: hypothetical protein CBD18_06055 [Opitutales bacterium TMED158]|nr:MAG: hypothetical protein CBD18_06055 [Opitutales bacterium TMED158]